MQDGTQLDPKVVKVVRAIRSVETEGQKDPYTAVGDNGNSHGAYQFNEKTGRGWKTYAKEYLGDENAPMSPANQNKVMYYDVKKKKDQGLDPEEIAALHNGAHKDAKTGKYTYNAPEYGVKFRSYLTGASSTPQQVQSPVQPTKTPQTPETQEGYKPWFESKPGEGGLISGLKAAGNVIPSAIQFGKGLIQNLNPINTARNLAEIPGAVKGLIQESGGVGRAAVNLAKEVPKTGYESLVPQGVRQAVSGDIEGAAKTFTEDPFGQAAPIVLAAQGGARLADRVGVKSPSKYVAQPYTQGTKGSPLMQPGTQFSDAFGKTVETVAKPVTKPLGFIGAKVGKFAENVGTSMASHITGMDRATIQQILSDPKAFSKIKRDNVSRGGLAGEVKTAIDTRLKDLQETGKGYEAVRNSNQTVQVPQGLFTEVLSENGLKVKGGRVVADSNSITRNTADLSAINKFYKDWGKKKTLTPNEFLNMRSDLAELSKFDKLTGMGKTRASETVGKSFYEKANKQIRDTQLEELKALDDTYAPEVSFLKQVKKDYFNPDGTFKDNAPSRIANAGNKAELLKRLENVMPGVTKRIEILKAVEDIERASGIKVGSYGRAAAGLVGFGSGGISGALIAQILTSPELAVPLLRGAGYTGAKAIPILRMLRDIAGDVTSQSLKTGIVDQDALRSKNKGLLSQTIE